MVRLDTTRIVPFPAVPPPKPSTACPGNERMELLLVRDLALMGLLLSLLWATIVVLYATRR